MVTSDVARQGAARPYCRVVPSIGRAASQLAFPNHAANVLPPSVQWNW